MSLSVTQWLDGYRKAWEERDTAAVVGLFTEDAIYREQPYEAPFLGRAGIGDYWTKVTATQDDVRLRYGTPIVDGRHAAVEWWVTMRNGGADVSLAGEFWLSFDDAGLCSELREYWHFAEGRQSPPDGWGE